MRLPRAIRRLVRAIFIIPLLICVLCIGAWYYPGTALRGLVLPIRYAEQIQESAARHEIDPYLICAMIMCESGWNEDAASSAGAVGLMQVMPSTSELVASLGLVDSSVYDPENLSDTATNIEYGCAYIQYLSEQFENLEEVIAAYNAGPGFVAQWLEGSDSQISETIAFPETQEYLKRVSFMHDLYKKFYPDGVADT